MHWRPTVRGSEVRKMGKWIKEQDNGSDMLKCSSCEARVILEWYQRAVGLNGYDYCPYCGEKMDRPKEIQKRIDVFKDCPWK